MLQTDQERDSRALPAGSVETKKSLDSRKAVVYATSRVRRAVSRTFLHFRLAATLIGTLRLIEPIEKRPTTLCCLSSFQWIRHELYRRQRRGKNQDDKADFDESRRRTVSLFESAKHFICPETTLAFLTAFFFVWGNREFLKLELKLLHLHLQRHVLMRFLIHFAHLMNSQNRLVVRIKAQVCALSYISPS